MKKHLFKVLSAILLISLLLSAIVVAVSATESTVNADAFTSVIMNVGANETQRNLTWYYQGNESAEVLYWNQANPSDVKEVKASDGALTTKEGDYYSYKATLKDLDARSTYVYQLYVGDTKSKEYTFNTYNFDGKDGGFTFAFTGDPQVNSITGSANGQSWVDTVYRIKNSDVFGNVSFIVSPGDQIANWDQEGQYDAFIINDLSTIGISTTVGPAHDAVYNGTDTKSQLYKDHYNLPNLSDKYGVSNTSADYYYTYGNALFMHLNVTSNNPNDLTEEVVDGHKAFMEEAMVDTDCTWNIVVMHYSFYSYGDHANDSITEAYRTAFVPVFDELNIDLVLSGHDHIYTRSKMIIKDKDGDIGTVSNDNVENNYVKDPDGTLYISGATSTGSSFYYQETDIYNHLIAEENDQDRKGVTIFTVTDTELSLKTYFLTDFMGEFDFNSDIQSNGNYKFNYFSTWNNIEPELIDEFTIEKTVKEEPEEPTATVTVDGEITPYYEKDLGVFLSNYNKDTYAGKQLVFTLYSDMSIDTQPVLNKLSGATIKVDLAGTTLTVNQRIHLQSSGSTFQLYSSKQNGSIIFAEGIQPNTGLNLIIGSKEYKNDANTTYLSIDSTYADGQKHIVTMSTLSDEEVFGFKLLYTNIITDSNGLIKLRAANDATVTLDMEITGCNITSKDLIQAHSSFTTSGKFGSDSKIVATNSKFTGSGSVRNLFGSGLTGRYLGTVKFNKCIFIRYNINGDAIKAENVETAITVDEGCEFTNCDSTFNSDKTGFAASNISVAEGYELKTEDGKVIVIKSEAPVEPDEPEVPDGVTVRVTVDGEFHKDYDTTEFLDIFSQYNNSLLYSGKEIVFTFNSDLQLGSDFYWEHPVGTTVKIDLASHKLTLAGGAPLWMYASTYTLQIYSSVPGGELELYNGILARNNTHGKIVIGSEEYKNNLTVTCPTENSEQQIVTVHQDTAEVTVEYLYCTIYSARYGLLRLNAINADTVVKLNAKIEGCTVHGKNIIDRENLVGTYSSDSSIVITDTKFEAIDDTISNFFVESALRDHYLGTLTFENCSFNGYYLNGNDLAGGTIIVGAGCEFTNSGKTFADGKFTASNVFIADGYIITVEDNKIVIAKPLAVEADVTCRVIVDGYYTDYTDTDFSKIIKNYASVDCNKIVFTLYNDITDSMTSAVKLPGSCIIEIDLSGKKLNLSDRIQADNPDTTLYIYSSKSGGELNVTNNFGFEIYKNMTLVIGADHATDINNYAGYLKVTGDGAYFMYCKGEKTINFKCYYSEITTGNSNYGLITNALTGDSTINVEFVGSTVNGRGPIFTIKSDSAKTFDVNSTFVAKDTTFKGNFTFFASNYGTRYKGTIKFDGCTFDGYKLNAGIISDATITVGAGCEFINYGDTFTDGGAFAASNIKLPLNCILTNTGSSMLVVDKYAPLTNITLHSKLEYNVYVPNIGDITQIFIDGNTIPDFNGLETVDINGVEYYKLPVYLNVTESMRDITLQLTVEFEGGKTGTGTWTLSLASYANALLAGDYTDVEKTLIKDLLSYIRSAYVYANTEETEQVVATINGIIGADYDKTSKPNTDVEKKENTTGLYSAAMELGDAPAFIFYIGEGYTAEQYKILVDDRIPECEVITEGDRTYIKVTMYAYAMAETVTYSIEGTDISGEYNIRAYYDYSVDYGDSGLVTLIERLWKYSESAKAYYESQNQ